MKCPICKGKGKYIISPNGNEVVATCYKCHGTGEVKMTNEEWFCQLTTEEKAEFLGNEGWHWNKSFEYTERSKSWLLWLKEVHKE